MKKLKIKKNYFDTFKCGPQTNLKQLFCLITQSQKSLPAYTAHTLANLKNLIFYFSPQVPYLPKLHDIKIIKIEEIENLTLEHF
jgi:hypothetical protein